MPKNNTFVAATSDFQAELGVMLGVYLPTIQHILGVTMFIRLFWMVGVGGIAQTFFLLFICCLCVSYSFRLIPANSVPSKAFRR